MGETFVLVHGAWHGAWCWSAVINHLERLGDRALALDLPGHGASQVGRAEVTLAAYVDSVVGFIEARNLEGVVLAGHSLGGITVSGVVQKIPQRIKRVIFISAVVLRDGERVVDTLPDGGKSAQAFEQLRALPDPAVEVMRSCSAPLTSRTRRATCRISCFQRSDPSRSRRCSRPYR